MDALKSENEKLLERIEGLESLPHNGASWEKVDGEKAIRVRGNGSPAFKKFETSVGPVYEIPS